MRVVGQQHRAALRQPQPLKAGMASRRAIHCTGILAAGAVLLATGLLIGPARGLTREAHAPAARVPAYATGVQQQLSDLQASTNELAPLLDGHMAPATAAVILQDAADRTEQAAGEAQALTPPACLAGVHRQYLTLLDQFATGISNGLAGAQANDAWLLSRGSGEIQLAAGDMTQLSTALATAVC